jgi:hypothetical protein
MLRLLIPARTRARIHWELVRRHGLSEVFARANPAMRISRVTSSTCIVIDGYPRSGNTYARFAFQHANGADLPISTHRHSPRSIESALRRGIPAIVLIRSPRDAINSYLQFDPSISLTFAMDVYKSYYESILSIASRVIIAPFPITTMDFGRLILECNTRFGSNFVPYERTEASEAEVAREIDRDAGTLFTQEEFHRVVARPSSARAAISTPLASLSESQQARLVDLTNLYAKLVELSGQESPRA